jgi:long-subunit fatty acid transport protein
MALGGTSFGIRNSSFVNHSNPASYTSLDTTSFVFEGGVYTQSSTLKTVSLSQKTSYSSIGSVMFGFPISKRIKASFGLLPFSSVGYKIQDQKSLVISPDSTVSISNIYDGSGGINKVYMGFGVYISHNLSVGVNADFLFGTIRRNSTSYFPTLLNANSYRQTTMIKFNDFNFNFGLQYTAKITKDEHLTLGFVYTPAMNLRASSDTVANMVSPTNPETIIYQLSESSTQNGNIKMPKSIGGGFSFEKSEKLLVAADVYWQNWAKFNMFGVKDSLKNSLRASLGLQIVPNPTDFNNYFKRVKYRLGISYAQTYLQLNGKQLSDFGVSFGAGFPVRKSQSDFSRGMVNVAFEIGQRGTTAVNLIKENYFRFTLSMSIYDFWFRKQKYY